MYFTYIILLFFRMPHPPKLMQNKVIISQNMLEFKLFLNIYEKSPPKNENGDKSFLLKIN